jgi:hypothetical protein
MSKHVDNFDNVDQISRDLMQAAKLEVQGGALDVALVTRADFLPFAARFT